MVHEIQSILDGTSRTAQSSQNVWEAISAEIFKRPSPASFRMEDKPVSAVQTSEKQEKQIPPKEIMERPDKNPADIVLTPAEKELGDRITKALGNRDTKTIDAIIRQYSEWPKSLAKIIDYANAHYDQDDTGISIAFSYFERNTVYTPGKETPRRGNAAETGYISYNYAGWNDTPGPDGRRAPIRIYPEKWGGGKIRTSAYSDKADDVNEPIKSNREDNGEKLHLLP